MLAAMCICDTAHKPVIDKKAVFKESHLYRLDFNLYIKKIKECESKHVLFDGHFLC